MHICAKGSEITRETRDGKYPPSHPHRTCPPVVVAVRHRRPLVPITVPGARHLSPRFCTIICISDLYIFPAVSSARLRKCAFSIRSARVGKQYRSDIRGDDPEDNVRGGTNLVRGPRNNLGRGQCLRKRDAMLQEHANVTRKSRQSFSSPPKCDF